MTTPGKTIDYTAIFNENIKKEIDDQINIISAEMVSIVLDCLKSFPEYGYQRRMTNFTVVRVLDGFIFTFFNIKPFTESIGNALLAKFNEKLVGAGFVNFEAFYKKTGTNSNGHEINIRTRVNHPYFN